MFEDLQKLKIITVCENTTSRLVATHGIFGPTFIGIYFNVLI